MIDIRQSLFLVVDSSTSDRNFYNGHLKPLKNFFEHHFQCAFQVELATGVPQQKDTHSCGYYVLKYIDSIIHVKEPISSLCQTYGWSSRIEAQEVDALRVKILNAAISCPSSTLAEQKSIPRIEHRYIRPGQEDLVGTTPKQPKTVVPMSEEKAELSLSEKGEKEEEEIVPNANVDEVANEKKAKRAAVENSSHIPGYNNISRCNTYIMFFLIVQVSFWVVGRPYGDGD